MTTDLDLEPSAHRLVRELREALELPATPPEQSYALAWTDALVEVRRLREWVARRAMQSPGP